MATSEETGRVREEEKPRLTIRQAMDQYRSAADTLLAADRAHIDAKCQYDATLAHLHEARKIAKQARLVLHETMDRGVGLAPQKIGVCGTLHLPDTRV